MDDLALRRRHRRQLDGATALGCLIGLAEGDSLDLASPAVLVAFGVQFHVLARMHARENGDAREVLDGVDGLATPADEDTQIFAGDLRMQFLRALGDANLRRPSPNLVQHPRQKGPQTGSIGAVVTGVVAAPPTRRGG